MLQILNTILANQLDPEAVMAKLDEILNAVNPNKAVETWDFQGMHRVQSPGKLTGDDGEMAAFQQLNKLAAMGSWKEVVDLSQAETAKVPQWLSPYFFEGVAYANFCRKDEAVKKLNYFVERAKGGPSFDQAVSKSEEILALYQKGGHAPQCLN